MNPKHPSLTVAILMYNEESNIGFALAETADFLKETLEDWEILVVDDGSTDGGAEIVEDFATKNPRVALLSHGENRGMGAGIATAIARASKEYFTFNAADGQIPARELCKMLPLAKNERIVLTTYEKGRESLGRGFLSWGFRVFLRAVTGIRFELEGIYLIPTRAAKNSVGLITANTFFFSFELIQRAIDSGHGFSTAQIECLPRRSGSSKVLNPKRVARVAFDALKFGVGKRLGR